VRRNGGRGTAGSALARRGASPAHHRFELLPVRATERTVWLFVRLRTDAGLTGLGEASDAFGFANTTREDASRMEAELRGLFALVSGRSPLDIEPYRQQGLALARARPGAGHRVQRDRAGVMGSRRKGARRAGWPRCSAGRVRDRLAVYANVNRATSPRTSAGFAAAAAGAFVTDSRR
jgi:hypothetical protein